MSAKGTILYVEDNSDNRMLVRRVLEIEGYDVVEAKDGLQAMERLESGSIDLALMDINMPDVDGYTLTARIRSMPQFARLPIVAMTANVMRGDRERWMSDNRRPTRIKSRLICRQSLAFR